MYVFYLYVCHFRYDKALLRTEIGIRIDRNEWRMSLYSIVPINGLSSDIKKFIGRLGTLLKGLGQKQEIFIKGL